MKAKHLLAISLLAICGGFAATTAIAQGDKPTLPPAAKDAADKAKKAAEDAKKQAEDAIKKATGGDHAASPGMDPKMMEEMMKAMQPGPMHQLLKKTEGEWDLATKFCMSPGMAWQESKATSKAVMILGGRYLQEDVSGTMDWGAGPEKFEGRATTAYDNLAKMFVSTWIDSAGTGMMIDKGQFDEKTKTCTTEGEYVDPMSGKWAKSKTTCTWKDDNTRYMEMWMTGPDGKLYKAMEITYVRKK